MKIAMLVGAGALMILTTANAQNVPAPSQSASSADAVGRTTFGVRAGVNFQNITGKYGNGGKMKNDLIPGFNVGVNAEIPIAKDFYVQPGLLLTTRGAKYDVASQPYDQTVHLVYLELPANLVYKPMLGTGRLIAGFGPYIDFGLGGKIKYSGEGAPADRTVKFSNTQSDPAHNVYYRRVGAGANLLFGYEFANKLSFQLNTQLGLTNINPKDNTVNSDATAKHVGFGVSAGYRF